MEVDEVRKDEIIEEKKADDEGRKGRGFGIDNSFINIIDDKKYSTPLSEEEKKFLKRKRNEKKTKKLKEINIELFGKKRKAKLEPGKLQEIFNHVIKSNDFTTENVITVAGKLQYKIDGDSIKLISELGKAKVSIKKVGVPSNICKKKLHAFVLGKLLPEMNVITDDRIVWDCFLGAFYFAKTGDPILQKFPGLRENQYIKSISLVTNKLFTNNRAIYGYCQDEIKDVALINEGKLSDDQLKKIATQINNKTAAFIENSVMPNNLVYNYYCTESAIICLPNNYDLATYIAKSKTVKCVNSKNNLSGSLKEAKINNTIGYYLNIHDVKLTDFSPSCLFTSPFNDYKMFMDVEYDYNTVYNAIDLTGITVTNLLNFPKNCVFWDNIGSFIEFLGLVKVTKKISEGLSKEITAVIEMYNQFKFAFSAWKSVYNSFENIILSFYDGITTKLTIDGVIKLKEKVDNFLTNYFILKNHSSYTNVGSVLTSFQFIDMMKIFYSQTAASDVVASIKKIISVLMAGNIKSLEAKITIEEMFRTTGIMCLECLYDGYWAMIPKIRSKVSFLGNVGGDVVTDENLRNNIRIITNLFEQKNASAAEDINDPTGFLAKKQEYDNIAERLLNNTLSLYNDKSKVVNKYYPILKKTIMLEPLLYNSMIDDISTFMSDPDYNIDSLLAYGNFLDNPDVLDFLSKADSALDAIWKVGNSWDMDKVLKSIQIKKNPKKKRIFTKTIGRLKNREPAPDLKTVKGESKINKDELVKAISKYEKEFEGKNDQIVAEINKIVDPINSK